MLMCILTTIVIIGWQHSKSSYQDFFPEWDGFNCTSLSSVEQDKEKTTHNDLIFHPFENACKFAISNIYASDFPPSAIERLRQLQCPYENFDLATMDSEGYMYVHPHYLEFPKYAADVKCKVVFLEGALRNNVTGRGKDMFREVAEVEAPANVRFFVNGDVFYIRCFKNNSKVFEHVYPGMRDLEEEPNQIYSVKDMESFDDYGKRNEPQKKEKVDLHYSIDILCFDSASRTMFMRHMPRTMETMNKLGYELFYGYNKVADNSEPNLVPILAGDIPEALEEPKIDEFGDINIDWVLPTQSKLDPDKLPLLWKMMEKEFGCRTMLNEDIGVKKRGLFHYPPEQFLPGFTSSPADHFYRTYYLAVYKNWRYTQCKDGGQVQRRYVDLWRRFSNKYRDICHMGFTFVTTLSHEWGFTLEPLDEQVSSSLENLHFTGSLDKGVSIIMGDHGNRVKQHMSYSGRIEERMPLMAIRLPPNFRKSHTKEYLNFLTNKWKLTSNFDIHQTLKDIALMSFGNSRRTITHNYGRGISLFEAIPANRSCFDAYIPENFCTCLIDRSNLSNAKIDAGKQKHILFAIQKFFAENDDLADCFNLDNITILNNASVLGLNPLTRHGFRKKENAKRLEEARKRNPKMDLLYHEVTALMESTWTQLSLRLLFRVEEKVRESVYKVVLEPLVENAPASCYHKSVFSLCKCLILGLELRR